MSDEIQNFKIKYIVDDSQLTESKAEIKGVTAEGAKLEAEFKNINKAANNANKDIQDGFGKSKKAGSDFAGIGKVIAGAFAVEQLINFQKQIIEITAKFQKYEAVLTNTLGSNSLAQKALRDIQDFAAKTPFSVDQLTESYVKLANQGFIPTTEELRKLGDLASSTGKSFDQLSEAILDAQSGQFERLKEFGIKASKEGDKVAFTFKGVKTETNNTSAAIQKYILSLGDLKGVSGSMAAISNTLEGQISNLGDAYDSLQLSIGRQESGALSGAISILNSLLTETTKAVNGQSSVFDRLVVTVKALSAPFFDLVRAISDVGEKFGLVKSGGAAVETVFFVIEKAVKIATLPIRFFIQEVITLIDLVTLNFDEVGKDFQKLGEIITLTDGNEKSALNSSIDAIGKKMKLQKDLAIAQQEAIEKAKKAAEDAAKLTDTQLKEIEKRFKADLDLLSKKESLAIREAKLLGASEEDLLNIERSYNNQRIEIYKSYGRAKGIEFRGVVFKEQEYLKQIRDLNIQSDRDILKDKIDVEQKQLDADAKLKAERIKRIKDEGNQRLSLLKEENSKLAAEKVKQDEADKSRQQQIGQEFKTLITDIGQAIFSIETNRRNAELNDLQIKYNKDISLAGESASKKAALTAEFTKKENKIKYDQAVADRHQAVFNLTMQNAQNIVKYIGGLPFTAPLLALAVATYGVQLGVILSKPLPKYNMGTKSVPGVDTGGDSITAMLRPGEGVMPVDRMNDYRPSFDAIFDKRIPKEVLNNFVLEYTRFGKAVTGYAVPVPGGLDPSFGYKLDRLNSTLEKLPITKIEMDKKGIRSYLQAGNSETEFLNNYFRN